MSTSEGRIRLYCLYVFSARVKATMFIVSNHPTWPKDQEESNFVHTLTFLYSYHGVRNFYIYIYIFLFACVPGVLFMSEGLRT